MAVRIKEGRNFSVDDMPQGLSDTSVGALTYDVYRFQPRAGVDRRALIRVCEGDFWRWEGDDRWNGGGPLGNGLSDAIAGKHHQPGLVEVAVPEAAPAILHSSPFGVTFLPEGAFLGMPGAVESSRLPSAPNPASLGQFVRGAAGVGLPAVVSRGEADLLMSVEFANYALLGGSQMLASPTGSSLKFDLSRYRFVEVQCDCPHFTGTSFKLGWTLQTDDFAQLSGNDFGAFYSPDMSQGQQMVIFGSELVAERTDFSGAGPYVCWRRWLTGQGYFSVVATGPGEIDLYVNVRGYR